MTGPHKGEPQESGSLSKDPGRQLFESDQTQFEVDFFERILRATPHNVDVLRVLGNHYTALGQYARGLEVDKKLIRLVPDDQVAWYNLACSYALLRDSRLALQSLRRSFELGYDDVDHLHNDSDLDPIRDNPAYEGLLREFGWG